jgi:signal transduction histidine kinase
VSIRFKVILPYLLLTLVIAITGVYVVTKLVANSLSERLTNQLLEAGRVVSDGMAREEIKHVENGRIIAFTRGLADAVRDDNDPTVAALAKPVATGLGIENLIVVDLSGRELLHLIKGPDGTLRENTQPSGAGFSPFVQDVLKNSNPQGAPERGLGLNPLDKRYYYFTSIPISLDNKLVGAVVIGTSLNTLLPYLKSTSLADVVIYANDGQAIATTLGAQNNDPEFLQTISIPSEKYLQAVGSQETISGENFTVDDRAYSLARGSLRVGNDRLGAFAVVLPLNYVLQSGAVSRDTYVILFTAAMIGVVLIGYLISRLIINPLYALMRTSQAISQGDLTKRSGIRGSDEIGILANTFDEMTGNLQERTAELEKTNSILEQMDRTKVSFIGVSAHELRTPLTLVKGYTQMLQQKANGDAEMGALVKGILDGTDRMNEIVSSMLDVSKIDSKTLKVVPDDRFAGHAGAENIPTGPSRT